jgi:hypothetical protein
MRARKTMPLKMSSSLLKKESQAPEAQTTPIVSAFSPFHSCQLGNPQWHLRFSGCMSLPSSQVIKPCDPSNSLMRGYRISKTRHEARKGVTSLLV